MVESEAQGDDWEIRTFLRQKAVARTWAGTPVAQEPAVGVSIILERKLDAGNPHVRFDERWYGNISMVKIETPTQSKAVGNSNHST